MTRAGSPALHQVPAVAQLQLPGNPSPHSRQQQQQVPPGPQKVPRRLLLTRKVGQTQWSQHVHQGDKLCLLAPAVTVFVASTS